MLQPLVVGLGRSGAGLHLRALRRVIDAGDATGPIIGCDRREADTPALQARTLSEAALMVDPESAVVHLCTPSGPRPGLLSEAAGLGFRRFVLEKPLADGESGLAAIEAARVRHRLQIVVVSHWLHAELTQRLADHTRAGELDEISFVQHKPRFLRSLNQDHPTAFDVEIPHALGVVLHLAGDAEVVDAETTDLLVEQRIPRMGSARLSLRHHNGVRTELVSDLTSPVRERSVRLTFSDRTITGHFPISEHDDHAQLIAPEGRRIFRDDALLAFMHHTYRTFATGRVDDSYRLHHRVTRLLTEAKSRCGEDDSAA